MCIIDSFSCSCSHIENIYSGECGTAGNRCAKQINLVTTGSACRRCLANVAEDERRNVIVDYYDNVKFYLTNALKLITKFDHDVLAPQVEELAKIMDEQKSFALLQLQLKIARDAQKTKMYHDDPSVWF